MYTLKMKEAEIKKFLARKMGDKLSEIALFVVELALVARLLNNVIVPVLHMFVDITFPVVKFLIGVILVLMVIGFILGLVNKQRV